MFWFFAIFVFIFGTLVGSFLNCIIYRLANNKSFLRGRSFCPSCSHTLEWYDLLPLMSFILLKARCRYCKAKISWQYPLVEIATGLLFLLIFNFQFSIFNEFSISNFQTVISIIYLFLIASLLIIIFVYDLKHYIIPDQAIYPAIAAILLYRLFESLEFRILDLFRISDFGFRIFTPFLSALLAGLVAAFCFFAIWFISRGKWLGFGDVKLAFFIGLFLGPELSLLAFFISFLSGAIIGLILIALKKKSFKSEVPFGPFLVFGTFLALFWGKVIIDWYLNLLTL